MAFLESPAERARKFREQQAGVKPAAPIAQPGIPMARPGSLAPPNTAAPALGALPAVVNWATNQRDVKPVAPAPTTNPTNKPVMLTPPAVAAPGASSTQARMSPGSLPAMPNYAAVANPVTAAKPAPSQVMTDAQASQAEVAARNQAPRPGTSLGAGASTTAGRAAPKPDDVNTYTNGAGVTKRVPMPGTPATASTIGSVNTQNFGNPVVPQGPGAIASPRVASTFGMGVNDPRLNDQTPQPAAIAQPPQNLPRPQASAFDAGFAGRMAGNTAAIERPGANFQMAVPNGAAYRSADQMAEQYNSREDRESRKQADGAIDTALFMARGKPGAEAAIANLLETKARLNSGAEGLSQEAVQGRANRGNQFGIADLNNAGENNRAGIQADVARAGQQVAREGQQLDFQASQIARPTLERAADGSLIQVSGTSASPVVGPDGKPVIGQPTAQASQRDYAREADDKLIADLLDMQRDPMTGALAPNAVQAAQQQFQQLRGAQNPQPAAPAGMKQVGTSGGKPVYEDAKGNRFTL
jgi:hypothetical protein